MFKRHFFSASQIFTTSTVTPQEGMPAFTDLKVDKNFSGHVKAVTGCGLYFFMHHRNLVYIGKFLGTMSDAFGGDIFPARWNRHISTLSLRGSHISISQANLARASAQGLPTDLITSLKGADGVKLAKDRGFTVPYKRLNYAAMHWNEFSCPSASWLPNIDIGYLQLEATAWSQLSISDLRKKVNEAETRAIEQISTVLNGHGEFDASAIKKISTDQVFDLLESMFNATGDSKSKIDIELQAKKSKTKDESNFPGARFLNNLPSNCLKETAIATYGSFANEPKLEVLHAPTAAEADSQAKDTNAQIESDFFGERFLEELPSECPEETVSAVYDSFASEPQLEIHHTKTNGGDLRIRTFAPRRRNIFTMYWQPKKQLFSCRIKLDPGNVGGAGVVEVKASSGSEPLPTEFKFDCSQPGAINNLIRLIKLAFANA